MLSSSAVRLLSDRPQCHTGVRAENHYASGAGAGLPARGDPADGIHQRRRTELDPVHQVVSVEVRVESQVRAVADVDDQPEQSGHGSGAVAGFGAAAARARSCLTVVHSPPVPSAAP
jgi:hypothetical protein